MKRFRDSQWGKFCKASYVLVPFEKTFSDPVKLSKFLHRIQRSSWFLDNTRYVALQLEDGRGSRHARAYITIDKRIALRVPARDRRASQILRVITYRMIPEWAAWHGPEFCSIYLAAVRQFMGNEAGSALKEAFKKERVKSKRPTKEAILRKFGAL